MILPYLVIKNSLNNLDVCYYVSPILSSSLIKLPAAQPCRGFAQVLTRETSGMDRVGAAEETLNFCLVQKVFDL